MIRRQGRPPFSYIDAKTSAKVRDKATLDYIKKLAIPPAYVDVRIYKQGSKILFDGKDSKGRLQQRYSSAHNKRVKREKFRRIIAFAKAEPRLKADVKKYLRAKRVTKNKIISVIVSLIFLCGFRVGQLKYVTLYDSFGVSTILKRHLKFNPRKGTVDIEFKGKKAVINKCTVTDSGLVRELKELTIMKNDSDHVFSYTHHGQPTLIKPTEINDFLRSYGSGTTSKDLRTFEGNILFINNLKKEKVYYANADTKAKRKKVVKKALVFAACHLNNTPAICKSSYLLPELYELAVEKPRSFMSRFGQGAKTRTQFIRFLKRLYPS